MLVFCEDPVIVFVRVAIEERVSEGAPEVVDHPEPVFVADVDPTLVLVSVVSADVLL